MTDRNPGRPRDQDIDDRILAVAREHLARDGYQAMSLAAVAEEAATTRQALYRRWSSKAELATAAIAAIARSTERTPTGDPFTDLVHELDAFRQGISRPDGISMVGTMLVEATDPDLVQLYRQRVVAPRRERLRVILDRARADGALDRDADLDVGVTMLTGSWYANALAGKPVPRRWSVRVARLVWRALGGTPPD